MVLLATCCAVLPMHAQDESSSGPAQPLYGTWYIFPLGNPDTDPIREEFRHDSATGKDELVVSRVCQGNYRAVIATAISPVEITASTIRVLKSSTATEKAELGSECHSSVDAGLLSYTLSPDNNRLTITNPAGKPNVLELARQDTASSSSLAPSLYGTWSLPVQHDGNMRIEIRLVFYSNAEGSDGRVRQIVTCMKGNSSMMAQADSDIHVTKDHISILKSASRTQNDGPYSCQANITAGSLRYAIAPNGATMTLYAASGPSLKLTREHGRGLN